MRQEQRFAAGKQWEGALKDVTPESEDYIGDMVQQMVNRKTASLYAKNPTPEAVMRERLNFKIWDGQHETIANCKQLVAQIAPQALAAHEAEMQGQTVPPPPAQMQSDLQQAQQILEDYAAGMAEKLMLKKIADTGTLLIKQQWGSQSPDMLTSAKQAVTRIIASRVAFIKVMYRRDMDSVLTESANDMEFSDKIETLQKQLNEIQDGITAADSPRVEEARILHDSIEKMLAERGQQEIPTNEGVVIDWLGSTSVIVDRRCRSLREFIGAHRIAHEIIMTVDDCEKKFGVSLSDSGARFYSETSDGWESENSTSSNSENPTSKNNKRKVCVWHVEDKDLGLCYVLCDGVRDFLKEPYTNTPEVNRFWSIVPVVFNCQEVEKNDPENDVTIYPRSDVRLMMPMQINVNVAGQEKRKHRAANRPAWVGVKSKFSSTAGQNDLEKLSRPRDGHEVLMLENLQPGEKISDYIQPLPKQPFDGNLYDNSQDSQAMMLATGQQPSDMGAQRPDEKATGQNIAAQARAASESSNIDDLNEAFSAVAQMCWEMLIKEMPQTTVQKLVGRGATWPEMNREDVADSIFFKISAGSMGRPNQQADLQKLQVLGPQLLQMFQAIGRSPEPLLKIALKTWDSNLDLDELLKESPIQAPQQQQPEQQRPPSVSISTSLKDLPPEEQSQAVEKFYGIQPAPPASRLINQVGYGKAMDEHRGNMMSPQDLAGKITP